VRVINCSAYLCAYSGNPSVIRGIAAVLKDPSKIKGVLPVDLNAEAIIHKSVAPVTEEATDEATEEVTDENE